MIAKMTDYCLEFLAEKTPHELTDIRYAYARSGSIDKVLEAIEYSKYSGLSLKDAIFELTNTTKIISAAKGLDFSSFASDKDVYYMTKNDRGYCFTTNKKT